MPAAGAESLAARLRDNGARVLGPQLGVTDETACRDSVQRTRAGLGGLDVLVNNAVMLLRPIIDADTEDWRRMMTTNVLGLMYMTHAAVPGMGEIVKSCGSVSWAQRPFRCESRGITSSESVWRVWGRAARR